MVKASSLKYGRSSPVFKKLSLVLSVLFVLLLLAVGANKFFFRSSDRSSDSKSTTLSVPDSLSNEINSIGFKVFQPKAIPIGFSRSNIEVVAEARTRSDCKEVMQNFEGEESTTTSFIDIYSYKLDCPYPRPGDESELAIGNYKGWASNPTQGNGILIDSLLLEIKVDDSYLRVETDLPLKVVEEMLKTLVPFNVIPPKSTLSVELTS